MMSKSTMLRVSFMEWWRITNRLLKSRGEDELLYGEARGWWNDLVEAQAAVDQAKADELRAQGVALLEELMKVPASAWLDADLGRMEKGGR